MAKRILVIDDDKSIARLLRDNLAFEGFVVAWSAIGDDAIPITRQFVPDLILLDLIASNT